MNNYKKLIFIVLTLFFPWFYAQNKIPTYLETPSPWADSLSTYLPIKDLIGQVFMVAAYPKKQDTATILSYIEKYKIGGIMFMQTSPELLVRQYNVYQAASSIPLLSSMDAEWGLAMRTDSVLAYPKAMALGAVQDLELIEKMAENMGDQFNRVGIHLNFAPVTDLNNNPKNPVINYRSFGEDPDNVTDKALAYHKGLHKTGVLSCVKHFPGHGNVNIDSHKTLPILNQTLEQLYELEFIPFERLIAEGIGCVMVGHLQVSAIDAQAASLSEIQINGILKQDLNYQGLVFTDALNMGAVKNIYPKKGSLGLQALLAGNDILVYPEDIPETYAQILEALESGQIKTADFRNKVRKILQLKEWLNLEKKTKIATENILPDLQKNQDIINTVVENSITLLKNEQKILPLARLIKQKITVVVLGESGSIFEKTLQQMHPISGDMSNLNLKDKTSFEPIDFVFLSKNLKEKELPQALEKINKNSLVVLSVNNMINNPVKNYNLNPKYIDQIIQEISKKTKKIVLNFLGNPYALNDIKQLGKIKSILLSYENTDLTQKISAQMLLGALSPKGKLPVNLKDFSIETGLSYPTIRLGFSSAEQVGMRSEILNKIDTIVQKAIDAKAFPGCKILVLKQNKIIFDRNYGFHTYSTEIPVSDSSIYDLASITKMVASTLALMKLESEKKIDISKSLGFYLPQLLGSAYSSILLKDILSHQAGLVPWIPFYLNMLPNPASSTSGAFVSNNSAEKQNLPSPQEGSTLQDSTTAVSSVLSNNFYNKYPNKEYSIQVADELHLKKEYIDSIFSKIINTPIKNNKQQYVYSDLGFYFIPFLLEKITKKNFKVYIEDIYRQLGLEKIGFLPLTWTDKSNIPPTEIDNYFRHQTVQGHVNDQGAALLGGVSGHAGIFSSAYDLAAIMQLFLNNGTYNGIEIFKENVMEKYNRNISKTNHRGLGFDKLREGKDHVASSKASWESFGHTGFTGTIAWVDPAYNLIFIFLSNRTYPSADNKLISKLNIRTQIHDLIYEALID